KSLRQPRHASLRNRRHPFLKTGRHPRRPRRQATPAAAYARILTAADKGKSAIHLARVYEENRRNFVGQSFWARGYFVSTVGRDEEVIRNYIRNQEQEDQRLEQMNLWR
ncbi:MAG TPA: transposase, partial [Acetobacteraceae bacterium]|nr:transposase [Acetobacteraceae bacterium]